jgi:hypothetical protein
VPGQIAPFDCGGAIKIALSFGRRGGSHRPLSLKARGMRTSRRHDIQKQSKKKN